MGRFTHNGHVMEKTDYGDYILHSDHAAELARVEKENALLRAECEAWRAVDVLQAEENDTGDEAVGMAEARYTLHRAMAATDAAGILKGAE